MSSSSSGMPESSADPQRDPRIFRKATRDVGQIIFAVENTEAAFREQRQRRRHRQCSAQSLDGRPAPMKSTADELIDRFEQNLASEKSFHHADHVWLAFEYLRAFSVLEALSRFSAGLKRFAAASGKTQFYNETITFAYFFLIRE